MASGLLLSDWPRKKAVLMSKEDKVQPREATVCKMVWRPSLVKVGLSRATSQSFGS